MYFSFVLLFGLIGSTLSCSCLLPPSLNDDFTRTPIIFIGRVIATSITQSNSFMGYADMTMEVEESFKGIVTGTQIIVRTNLQGSMCGFGVIPVGARSQMWLTESKVATSCSRSTRNVERDRDTLRKLATNGISL